MNKIIMTFVAALLSTSLMASPFESFEYIRFPFLTAKVFVEGNEYYLLGIDGVDGKEILANCEAQFTQADCETGFVNDYKGTMEGLGYTVGSEAKLRLYIFKGHQVVEKTVDLVTEVEFEVEIQ